MLDKVKEEPLPVDLSTKRFRSAAVQTEPLYFDGFPAETVRKLILEVTLEILRKSSLERFGQGIHNLMQSFTNNEEGVCEREDEWKSQAIEEQEVAGLNLVTRSEETSAIDIFLNNNRGVIRSNFSRPVISPSSPKPSATLLPLQAIISEVSPANLNAKLSPVLSYDSENSSTGLPDLSHLSASSPTTSSFSSSSSDSSFSPAAVSPSSSSSPTNSSNPAATAHPQHQHHGRRSRDEKVIASLGIPYTAETIINCSMEEFNQILVNSTMREDQINTCRDIRRRGKNKIAAQNCRKRKVDQIQTLVDEVETVKERKANLLRQRAELEAQQVAWQTRLNRLEQHILSNLGREGGDWMLKVLAADPNYTSQVEMVPAQ